MYTEQVQEVHCWFSCCPYFLFVAQPWAAVWSVWKAQWPFCWAVSGGQAGGWSCPVCIVQSWRWAHRCGSEDWRVCAAHHCRAQTVGPQAGQVCSYQWYPVRVLFVEVNLCVCVLYMCLTLCLCMCASVFGYVIYCCFSHVFSSLLHLFCVFITYLMWWFFWCKISPMPYRATVSLLLDKGL